MPHDSMNVAPPRPEPRRADLSVDGERVVGERDLDRRVRGAVGRASGGEIGEHGVDRLAELSPALGDDECGHVSVPSLLMGAAR